MTFETPVLNAIEDAEERGEIEEIALEALALEHDLDDDELAAAARRARGARGRDRSRRPRPRRRRLARRHHEVLGSTDSLTLFMNRAGRYQLLTAAEEVELAKRVERGDPRRRSG